MSNDPRPAQGDLFADAQKPVAAPSRRKSASRKSWHPDFIGPLPMEMGIASPTLTRMTLPYKKPSTNVVEMRSGTQVLRITALSSEGLPYGKYPRLILFWLTEQARINAEKYPDPNDPRRYIIHLGEHVSSFIASLGTTVGGRQKDEITAQLRRLASTAFHVSDAGDMDDGKTRYVMVKNIAAAESLYMWEPLDSSDPSDAGYLHSSQMQLSPAFFDLLRQNAFPYNKEILRHISQRPMAIDAYMWLTQCVAGMHYSKRPVITLKWENVMAQMGTACDPNTSEGRERFRRTFNRNIALIQEVWRDLRVTPSASSLVIHRTAPSVPFQEKKKLPKSD